MQAREARQTIEIRDASENYWTASGWATTWAADDRPA
jgi:hypothetical protein